MSVYQLGTAINLVQNFWTIDPITEVATPANPTTVTFTVEAPDGTQTNYVFGTDGNVTNPSVGTFICRLIPPLAAGDWRYYAVGTGTVEATSPTDTFTILENGLVPSDQQAIPSTGPLQQWITVEDLISVDLSGTIEASDQRAVNAAYSASQLLYEISGRIWPGIQQRLVRPQADRCACWGSASIAQPWYWTLSPWGGPGNWYWGNECGDRSSCQPLSRVRLAGYPVRDIIEVQVGEDIYDPSDPDQMYRLDRNRWLTRLSNPGPPPNTRFWPPCQDMTLNIGQPGTFAITYNWGQAPPLLGKMAAAQLGIQLFYALYGSDDCQLPAGVTHLVRQGVTFDRGLFVNLLDPSKPTGLVALDMFLRAYWRPRGVRRPAIWNPDRQGYARPEGIRFGGS